MRLRSGKSYEYKKYVPKKRTRKVVASKPTVRKIVSNIKYLNRAVKGETKYFDIFDVPTAETSSSVAQLYADGGGPSDIGWFLADVTPLPKQGTADNERVGNQIKLKSYQLRIQGEQQKQLTCKMKLKCMLLRVKGSPVDAAGSPQAVMARIFEKNPMSGFTDYHSIRNTSFFNEFEVISTKTIVVMPDTIRTDTTGGSASQIMDYDLNRKLSRAVRWDTYNPEALSNGQILMVILASTGNNGTVSYSNSGVFNGQEQSGVNFTYAIRWNYTDK